MSKRALSPWIFMTSRNTFRKSGSCIVLHTRRRRGIKSVRKFEIQRRCTFLFSCDRVTKKKKEGKKKKGGLYLQSPARRGVQYRVGF